MTSRFPENSPALEGWAKDWRRRKSRQGLVRRAVDQAQPSGLVYFQIDVPAGNCAAGAWLKYTPPAGTAADQVDNVKGAYALLLAAVSSGARIAVYGDDSMSPCPITSVSVLAN